MKNLIIAAVLIVLSGGIYMGLKAQKNAWNGTSNESLAGYKIGDTATDFELKNVDEQIISMAAIKDAKGYIVVFTSNVCPFAVLYQDRLIELHNKMAPKGYPVVAINSNDPSMQEGDSFENMKIRAEEKGFPFVYLQDEGQQIYPQYGATKTPHVFLLDKELTVQYIGAIDDNSQSPEEVKNKYVEDAIAALENGELPNPNTTKAIGCPIKAKRGGGGHAQRGGRRGPPSPEKILEMMDKDNDEKVSSAEAHGPLKKDFSRIDTDSDGYLTTKELSAMKPPHRRN